MTQQDNAVPQAAGAVSIDSPEFLALCVEYAKCAPQDGDAYDDLVKHADVHSAQLYEAGFQSGLKYAHAQALIVTHNLMAERDEAKASLARLVEGVKGLSAVMDAPDTPENKVALLKAVESLIALLPAKADKPEGGA